MRRTKIVRRKKGDRTYFVKENNAPKKTKRVIKTNVSVSASPKTDKPYLNIVTRTSGRPNAFRRCHESIKSQTYPNIRHIVSIDNLEDKFYVENLDIDYYFIDRAELESKPDIPDPKTGKKFPFNLYFNELFSKTTDGWILILDDDDYLANENVVEQIMARVKEPTDLICFQMQYPNGSKLPSDVELGGQPRLGRIGSPCVVFHHSMTKDNKFDGWKCGDFRFINRLWSQTQEKKVIPKALISLGGAGFGLRRDIQTKVEVKPQKKMNTTEGFLDHFRGKFWGSEKPQSTKEIKKFHPNSKNEIYSTEYTYHFLKKKLENGENFTYLRFGDNDFMHILEENKGKPLGHNRTVFNNQLKKDLTKALSINNSNYIKTYNYGSYSIENKIFKNYKKHKFNRKNYNLIRKYDKNKTFHNVLFFYTIAGYFPNYTRNIFKYIKRSEEVLYVGGTDVKFAKGVIGEVKTHIKTPKTNATSNIQKYKNIIDDKLESNKYKYIILACGQLSRVLGGYIYNKYGNSYTVLDIGGIIETFYPKTSKRAVLNNKDTYCKNFDFDVNDYNISITVLPSRLNKIKTCIKSLLNQDFSPDVVDVWLPKICKRSGNKTKTIPTFLKHPLINTHLIEDKGSISKLYFSLKKYKDNKFANIITVDDDVKYAKNMLNVFSFYANKKPNSTLCLRGRILNKNNWQYNQSKLIKGNKLKNLRRVDIVTGTWGALYKPLFFDESFFNLSNNKSMHFTDDIWISGHLAKNSIPIYVTPIRCNITPLPQHKINPLWDLNKDGINNNKSINILKEYFK